MCLCVRLRNRLYHGWGKRYITDARKRKSASDLRLSCLQKRACAFRSAPPSPMAAPSNRRWNKGSHCRLVTHSPWAARPMSQGAGREGAITSALARSRQSNLQSESELWRRRWDARCLARGLRDGVPAARALASTGLSTFPDVSVLYKQCFQWFVYSQDDFRAKKYFSISCLLRDKYSYICNYIKMINDKVDVGLFISRSKDQLVT